MVYEMLTGKQPYLGTDAIQIAMLHTNSRVGSALETNPNASNELNELMLNCTEPNPENRPQNATDALTALENIGKNSLTLPEHNLDETLILDDPYQDISFTEVISGIEKTEENPFESFAKRNVVSKWVIASLLVFSLGSFGGWWFGSGPGALVAIPNVSDKTTGEATNLLQQLTTEIAIRKVFSSTFAEGQVVGTEPPAGLPVTKGSGITLLVSKGKEMISVPSLLGLDLVTATAKLVGAHLSVGKVTEWFNSDYSLGSVYSYSGDDKTKLATGSSVDIKISLGAIPVVAGFREGIARAALEVAGLTVRKSVYRFSDTIAKGEVIEVVPDEAQVGKGSTIKLVVSRGPNTVLMPKVKGETILAAQALLESLGLKVVIDTKWLSQDYGIKKVTGASENAGVTIKVGSSVTIRAR